MSESDPLRRYVEAGLALTQLTRARAEAIVKELVKAGDVQREHAQDRVEELLDRSRKGTDGLAAVIRRELAQQLSSMGFATKEDLARLEARLEGRLAATTRATPPAGTTTEAGSPKPSRPVGATGRGAKAAKATPPAGAAKAGRPATATPPAGTGARATTAKGAKATPAKAAKATPAKAAKATPTSGTAAKATPASGTAAKATPAKGAKATPPPGTAARTGRGVRPSGRRPDEPADDA